MERKEAIEIVRKLYNESLFLKKDKEAMVTLIPELAESEDERMIKSINRFISHYHDVNFPTPEGFTREELVSWLEKHGKQKPILDVEIPFGAKDSELVEETITIPDGCYAIIEDNKVILRKGEKKSTWSEEDKKMLDVIYSCVDSHYDGLAKTSLLIWLKSLRPQSTWKPSDEQMEVLIWCKPLFADPKSKGILESLINDLKKLREE